MYVFLSREEKAMNQEYRNKECDDAYKQASTWEVDGHCCSGSQRPGRHENGTGENDGNFNSHHVGLADDVAYPETWMVNLAPSLLAR